jgi:CheY-like chemotaxis protein
MEPAFDYKQFIVLLVDDEEPALRYFKRAFRILTATSADEGLTLLRQHKVEIGVLIADSRMPGRGTTASGFWSRPAISSLTSCEYTGVLTIPARSCWRHAG